MSIFPRCINCFDHGIVCENHPGSSWPEECDCGAGMPCPECCDPVPQDGKHSIAECFTPRHLR
jgi:hypothetical protein